MVISMASGRQNTNPELQLPVYEFSNHADVKWPTFVFKHQSGQGQHRACDHGDRARKSRVNQD